ncbi:MAG: divergent polysaccharide deacetylase family protein [Desulfurivibrio sp.]|nr:divergent polysaccharide deacetylase family protein [Desulfurivibrio sp.]
MATTTGKNNGRKQPAKSGSSRSGSRKSTAGGSQSPAGGRKTAKRAGGRRKNKGFSLPWRSLLLILLLLISLGALGYLVFLYQPPVSDDATNSEPRHPAAPAREEPASTPQETPATVEESPAATPPVVASPKPEPQPKPGSRPALAPLPVTPSQPPLAEDSRPRLALIIDDMGFRPDTERRLLSRDWELTFAFIPFAKHLHGPLETARQQGREILLHLPLEARDERWNDASGMLKTAMDDAEIADGFAAALAQVPMATGVNNHMGSRFTADSQAMDALMAQVAHYELFFLDSLTIAASVAEPAAARHQVPFLKRDLFIDNQRDKKKIIANLKRLLEIAADKGQAVGIGHPYPATVNALEEFYPQMAQTVRLVPLSLLYEKSE